MVTQPSGENAAGESAMVRTPMVRCPVTPPLGTSHPFCDLLIPPSENRESALSGMDARIASMTIFLLAPDRAKTTIGSLHLLQVIPVEPATNLGINCHVSLP